MSDPLSNLSDVVQSDYKLIRHIQVPISYDTDGLSVPVEGVIPGVVVYNPKINDILLDAWVEINEAWDGTNPKGDMGTFVDSTNGIWNWGPGPLHMSYADEVASQGKFLVAGNGSNNLSLALTSVNISSRMAPAKFVTNDDLKFIVSTTASTEADDPESTQGQAIVHLLIIPA